jgi:hypothetical protein
LGSVIEGVTTADVTVSVVVPEILPGIGSVTGKVAVIVVDPVTTAVAIPVVAIVATVVLVELQVTVAVRSAVELSEYVPVAVNCWVAPTVLLVLAGETAIDESVGVVVCVAVPELVFVEEVDCRVHDQVIVEPVL